jgi:pseudaminic acid cytidylyltransferase
MSSPHLAIIPARGGSKRIPRKNVRPFFGKPMIVWTIEAAQRSGLFGEIVVSTDDEEIAQIAEKYGAKAPFRRPPDLANDYSPTVPVIGHAVEALEALGWSFDKVCCIYATAPFVTSPDLRAGRDMIQARSDADFVVSVTEFPSPVQRGVRIAADGAMQLLQPEHSLTRSQDLEPAYHDAAQFYWGTKNAFTHHQGFFTARAYPVLLPRHRVNDIDSEEDWVRAEKLFEIIRPDVIA